MTQTRAKAPASFEGRERIRLFCALRLPPETVRELVEWQRHAFGDARDVRVLSAEHLHITLAFLGHRPVGEVESILDALREAAAGAERPLLSLRRYRETRSVGMLALDDEGGRAGLLARDLHTRLEALGVYEPERREWLPHVTVLRFKVRPRLRPQLPDLERFSPSDAAVYLSRLRPGGAQYEVLESVVLGGR
ncbi:MAG: RNA 2',3'-cyclic phosphodiesterase [Actinobacteria bacterium]|nr:MAG: RNA 2',3'-cyclic phosphodiesterase [Actinomycetota bacterium]